MLKKICSILVMLSIITTPIGVYADEMSNYMIDTLTTYQISLLMPMKDSRGAISLAARCPHASQTM